jgi:putative ABC transport system permease protein
MSFFRDLRVAFQSLKRSKGLSTIVILTLALGIGANAAIFTLVRGVLLKPLVNRDENRLMYIRQSAPQLGADNTTFSVPEVKDIEASVHSVTEFGDFSSMSFTMVGLGEPRSVQGGVVSGNYVDVMGLRPVLGRLVGPQDDGPNAAGVIVLTYRFWSTVFKKDPSVIGKTVRLSSIGDRSATVIGVLEPSVPYPADTEIIANLVTSPHHLSATMVTGRVHRMTELFGKLAPGVTIDQARNELRTTYASMLKDHPEAYPDNGGFRIDARMLRDQITSGARTVLLVLLAASGLVFIIACSNVANLILARTVRREGELAVRAALGASTGALRRMLLAESLLLCGAGAAIALIIAQPLVTILARYASRFSVRALDLTVDFSMLWVGVALAIVAAVILAFVPRLPSANSSNGMNLASGGVRITSSTSRRQRIFAVTQIAASFALLAGASMLITTLIALQKTQSGVDTRHVLAIDVPPPTYGNSPQQVLDFYKESIRRINALPGVTETAFGMVAPWRDVDNFAIVSNSLRMVTSMERTILARSGVPSLPVFFPRSAFPLLPAAISLHSMTGIKSPSPSSAPLSHSACFLVRIRLIDMSIGPIQCSSSLPAAPAKRRVSPRLTESLASPPIWTTNTSFLSPYPPFTPPLQTLQSSSVTS